MFLNTGDGDKCPVYCMKMWTLVFAKVPYAYGMTLAFGNSPQVQLPKQGYQKTKKSIITQFSVERVIVGRGHTQRSYQHLMTTKGEEIMVFKDHSTHLRPRVLP